MSTTAAFASQSDRLAPPPHHLSKPRPSMPKRIYPHRYGIPQMGIRSHALYPESPCSQPSRPFTGTYSLASVASSLSQTSSNSTSSTRPTKQEFQFLLPRLQGLTFRNWLQERIERRPHWVILVFLCLCMFMAVLIIVLLVVWKLGRVISDRKI